MSSGNKLKAIHIVYANWCPHCVPTTVEPLKKAASEIGVPCVLYDIDAEGEGAKADELVRNHGDWSPDYIIPQAFFELENGQMKHVFTGYSEGVSLTNGECGEFVC